MDASIFEHLRALIHREAGIYLAEEKKMLLANRLGRRLRELGLSSEKEYLRILELDTDGQELVKLIDAVSTNVTHFYREGSHFEALGEILGKARQQGRHDLKIWCAASSSGEEPYTLAMVVREQFRDKGPRCQILATDISTKVLRHAIAGQYEERQLEKLPSAYRKNYFQHHSDNQELPWSVTNSVKELVTFKKLNLAKFPYPLKGPIDVIFCRNVMIYFDIPLRSQIISEFSRLLRPGGYLFLSHSENLLGIENKLEPAGRSAFRKPER